MYCPGLPDWHYEDEFQDGPSTWGDVNDLCDHEQQSPITIYPDAFADDTCSEPLNWNVDDTQYNWTVTHKGDAGYTLLFKSDAAKSDVYLENSWQYTDQHEKYKLHSFHLHWGPGNQNGSEHVYDGVTTTLEVHFVHYSSDYKNLSAAVGAWDALSEDDSLDMHTLGVVGFLYEEVEDDEDFNLMADMTLLMFAADAEMDTVWSDADSAANISFSIYDLVDPDDFMTDYYHYWGSLTTPPCTPAVSWHLAQNTIKVRKSTMEAFRAKSALWTYSGGIVDATTNFRPVQDNPSCITVCGGTEDDDGYCPGDIQYPDWHYEDELDDGPSSWGNVNALCDHEQQSPITIYPDQFGADDTCSDILDWHVDDTVYDWTVTHKGEGGHTLSVYSSEAKNDVYLDNDWQTTSLHDKYKLYGFHFHWGPDDQSGSEHIFDGTTTTFEVHFVHYSNSYVDIGEALGAWEELSEDEDADMHTLGVVGFLFEEVDDDEDYNEDADDILMLFATDSQMDEVWRNASGSATLSFAITDLVEPQDFESNYYHYWGSLTTPPCTPAVSWHLAQNTIKVRKSTIDTFRARTTEWTMSGGLIDATTNFRPVQDNPSCISQCYNDEDLEYCPGDEHIDYPTWHYEDS